MKHARAHERDRILRIDSQALVEFYQRLVILSGNGVELGERQIGADQSRLTLERLEECGLRQCRFASHDVDSPQQFVQPPRSWDAADLPFDPLEGHVRFLLDQRQSDEVDRKSTRLNSSHSQISYAVFCLKKKKP